MARSPSNQEQQQYLSKHKVENAEIKKNLYVYSTDGVRSETKT